MKRTLVLSFLAFCFFQKSNGQNISYSIRSDDPHDMKKMVLHLDPFYADCWGTNMTIGFGIRADYVFTDKLHFALGFRKAYLDMNSGGNSFNSSMVKPGSGLNKLLYFEPSASFSLLDWTSKKNLKIVLSSTSRTSGSYTITNTKYIHVPGTVRQALAARGGITYINAAISFSEGDAEKDFKATNQKDKSDFFNFGSYGVKKGGSDTYGGYSMMKTATLFAGVSYKYITNLIVDVDRWGKRSNASFYDIYFDLMFAPVVSFKDVVSVDKTEWSISNNNKSRTGWRAGMKFRHPDKVWLSYEFAFGKRPGFSGNAKGILQPRAFLDITMGISIPHKGFN